MYEKYYALREKPFALTPDGCGKTTVVRHFLDRTAGGLLPLRAAGSSALQFARDSMM